MCGKYLKARQLAKEMEKKAKKTAEMKEEAQNEKERAEELFEDLNSLDIDIGLDGLKEKLEESENHLDQKDFEEAFEVSREVVEDIMDKGTAKVKEILNPLEETLEEIENNTGIEAMREDIEKSTELIKDNNVKGALNKALDIKERSSDLFEEKLKREISNLDSLFDKVEGDSQGLENAEELLSKAEYSLEAEDYSRAFSLLKESKESLGEDVKDQLKNITDKLEQRVEDLEEKGENLEEGKDALDRANTKIDEDLIESWRIIRGALDNINKVYGEEVLSKAFEKLDKEIKEAENIDAPTQPLKDMVKEAEELKEQNKILEVENLLDEAFEQVEEAKFDKVLNTIAESREDFIKAKEMGADIERPMELLKKARNSLKNDDYKEALEWAEKGREEVEDLTNKLEELKNEVERKREEINKLEETLDEDFSSLEEVLEKAKSKLEAKSPEESVSKLEELDEKIEEKSRSKVEELSEEFEKLNELAKDIGIEVGDLSKQQVECKKKIVSSDYFKAANMAMSGKKSVEKKIREKIEEEKQRLTDEVEEIRGLDDETVKKVLELLTDLEKAIKDDSLVKAKEKMMEAKSLFTDRRTELCEQIIEYFSQNLGNIKEIGVELEEKDRYEQKIEEAKKELSAGEERESLDILLDFIPEMTKEINEITENELKKAEEAGVQIKRWEEDIELSEEKIESSDFIESFDLSVNALKEIMDEKEKREKAYERLEEGASRLSDLEEEELPSHDLDPVKNKLKDSKEDFKDRDYSVSIEKTEEALNSMEKIEVRGMFSKSKKNLKNKAERAKGLDTSGEKINEFETEIENIDELAEKGSMSEAQDLLEEKREELDEILLETTKGKIKEIEDFLKASANMGFDVESHRNDLKRAKSFFEKEEPLESLELIEEIDEELTNLKGKGEIAIEELEEARCLLKKAEIIGADVSGLESKLEEGENELANDRYSDSLEKTRNAKEKIIEAKKKRISNIIEDFNQKIEKLRSKDVDTALAENKLKKANKALENGDYSNSIRLALQSEGELEKINKQKVIAKNSLSRVKDMLEKLKDKEIFIDEAQQEIQRCEDAYDSGFYPKAVETAVNASEELHDVLRIYRSLDHLLESFDLIISELERDDFDVSELSEVKKDIEDLFRDGKYGEAEKEVEKAEEVVRTHKEELKEVISRIKQEISKKGLKEVDKSINKLEKGKFLLDLANPIKALNNIYEAEDISGLKNLREYDELVSQVEVSIKNAKKFGASVKDVEDMIQSAKEKRESRDIIKAHEEIKKANDEIENVLEAYSPKLNIEVTKTLTIDKWNTCEVHLVNEGQALGNDPQIEVRGGEIRNVETPEKFKGGEERNIKGEIKPKKENAVIIARALRIFDDEVFEDEEDLNVSMGSKVKRASESKICDYCGNKIMKSEKLVLCSCDKKYDMSCANEISECPNCGTHLETEEKEEKSKKRVSLDL